MTKQELIEQLADIEHQRWSDWQAYLHSKCCKALPMSGTEGPGSLIIYQHDVAHWERLIATAYADLPEHSKQSDRDQVMRYWPLIVEFVGHWLEQASPDDFARNTPAEIWLEDMA